MVSSSLLRTYTSINNTNIYPQGFLSPLPVYLGSPTAVHVLYKCVYCSSYVFTIVGVLMIIVIVLFIVMLMMTSLQNGVGSCDQHLLDRDSTPRSVRQFRALLDK